MKYFTIDELSRSSTADQLKVSNAPTVTAAKNLMTLVDKALDPIREKWGHPIKVNSGYRGEVVNRAAGGAKTSQHCLGEAADITTGNQVDNKRLFELIRQMAEAKQIEYDQLIWEKGDNTGPSWIHISYRAGNNRHQILNIN